MDERTLNFSVAPGERIYAVGDVHGCREELERLMRAVRIDVEARAALPTRLVFLGDLIDRGPEAAGVLRRIMALELRLERFQVLLGNHEQLMARALEGDLEAMALWLNVGGGETLASFRVASDLIHEGASDRLLSAARAAVGAEALAWLLRRPLTYRSGQVLFVHAGIRPGVALERQVAADLLWIREPFLSDAIDRDFLVVHGHTVYEAGPCFADRRIGIDTGAYATGRLTALALEGDRAWTLSS